MTLADELEHVDAYLQIEQARFADRLNVDIDLPEHFLSTQLPAFSLQPIVENAIKHGTSQILGPGRIHISAHNIDGDLALVVEDNAGLYEHSKPSNGGLGMSLVGRRITARYGAGYGLSVACEPEQATRVILRVPLASAENLETRH